MERGSESEDRLNEFWRDLSHTMKDERRDEGNEGGMKAGLIVDRRCLESTYYVVHYLMWSGG